MKPALLSLRRWALIAIGLTFIGCADSTSQNAGELRPLWIVNADRASESIGFVSRVVQGVSSTNLSEIGFEQPIGNYIADLDVSGVPVAFLPANTTDVRLTGGDVLTAHFGGSITQLYRRDEAFIYSAIARLEADTNEVELRLDYSGQRFEPGVKTVQIFEVNNLMISELGQVVPDTGVVNLSWNLGDTVVEPGGTRESAVLTTLQGCETNNVRISTEVTTLDNADRSITLSVNALPRPVLIDGTVPAPSSSPGECTYSFQIAVVTQSPATTASGFEEDGVDPTPQVALVSRSNARSIRVANGPEVSP